MGLIADATALVVQAGARRSATYGRGLYFAGVELDEPEPWKVPTRHGSVRCEVYRPPGVEHPPAYVHFHGGAFMMRYPRMDDYFARFLVAEAGVAVVNVDYGVAPRRRYPVAHEQAHDVVRWLGQHAADGDVDGLRLAVGGFSSGGNLAASVCLQLRDSSHPLPRLQLLVVPSLDVSNDTKPASFPDPMIGPGIIRLAHSTYFKDVSRRTEPYASPLLTDDVHALPPAVVVTAERDALRAEGDEYADRLHHAGVDVVHRVVPGRDHYVMDETHPAQAHELMSMMATEISRRLA